MTSASMPRSEDTAAVETAGRVPLLLLLAKAIGWLLLSGVFTLTASVQAHEPGFLSGCPVLSFGRVRALGETAFIYGWVGNAGLATVLWLLARLAGEPLRTVRWIVIGALFWNLSLTIAMVGIAIGDATAVPWLELPRYAQPTMLLSYGAVALGGVLAWTGRRRQTMFAAQWYGAVALFSFPWLFSAGQVMLLWFPLHGVVQAIAAGWFAQNLWTLWLAPVALSSAYYLTAKLTGRALPGYELAPAGFWCLVVIGGWTGGRHLVLGPVPAWIGSVAVVASALLVFHYMVVGINLRPVLGATGATAKFVGLGLVAYVLGGLTDAVTAFREVAVTTQFTYFDQAQRQLALYGAVSMILYGALYYAVPRVAGRAWYSGALRRGHFILALSGLVLLVGGLATAGIAQGLDLNNAAVTFAAIAAQVRPALIAASAGQGLLLLGNAILAVNFLKTAARPFVAAEVAAVRASFSGASAT